MLKESNSVNEIFGIVNIFNEIKKDINFSQIEKSLIMDIFITPFMELRSYDDSYFFQLDDENNISIYETLYDFGMSSRYIKIEDKNKKIIEDIILNKGYQLFIIDKDKYLTKILENIREVLNYPLQIKKSVYSNKGKLETKENYRKKEGEILESIDLSFKDYLFKNKITFNQIISNITIDTIKVYLPELKRENINFNIKTCLLNYIYGNIDFNVKQLYIEDKLMKIYATSDNEDRQPTTEELDFLNKDILLPLFYINSESEIISKEKYNTYDILTFPIKETIFDKTMVLPNFNLLDENKALFSNNKKSISFLPLINIKNIIYGLVKMDNLDIKDNILLYRQFKDNDRFDIIDTTSKNIKEKNIIELINTFLDDFIVKNINGNINNLNLNNIRLNIGDFITK